jgi:hypothetical protein
MERNVGGRDQMVRFVIAGAGITMGLFAKRGWLKGLGFGIGGTELATAIIRYSLFNKVLHRNTAPQLPRAA